MILVTVKYFFPTTLCIQQFVRRHLSLLLLKHFSLLCLLVILHLLEKSFLARANDLPRSDTSFLVSIQNSLCCNKRTQWMVGKLPD